jgi:hypothetical protein
MIFIEIKSNILEIITIFEKLQDPNVFLLDDRFADVLIKKLGEYPRPSRAPQPFRSAKQRRWFFAALEDGTIKVPYQRTEQLMKGWKKEQTPQGVTVFNTVPYASLVQGRRNDQSPYHRATWKPYEDVAKDVDKTISPILDKSAQETINTIFSRSMPLRVL